VLQVVATNIGNVLRTNDVPIQKRLAMSAVLGSLPCPFEEVVASYPWALGAGIELVTSDHSMSKGFSLVIIISGTSRQLFYKITKNLDICVYMCDACIP